MAFMSLSVSYLRRVWRHRGRLLWIDVNLTMVNRPHVMLDDERRWIAFSWGNGYSDPVWSVQIGPWRQ